MGTHLVDYTQRFNNLKLETLKPETSAKRNLLTINKLLFFLSEFWRYKKGEKPVLPSFFFLIVIRCVLGPFVFAAFQKQLR